MLQGEPRNLQPADRSPFVQDEGERVPEWPCTIIAHAQSRDIAQLPPALRAHLSDPV